MSKTSCSAIDELYAWRLSRGKMKEEDIPKFRHDIVVKRAAELEQSTPENENA